MSYFPEPDSHIGDKFKEVFDLSNYAIERELEHDTSVHTSDLGANIGKLKTVPIELKKLLNVVDN